MTNTQSSAKPARTTLAGFFEHREEIKHSRFIARACSVNTPDEASAWISQHRDPEATHNAWAWSMHGSFRFHDDGEVSGTAGKPIWGAIEKQGLDRVVVLVTRYYGGIQLGAGGLARAYGGAAATCLRLAPKRLLQRVLSASFQIPFSEQGRTYHLFERYQIERLSETFTDRGVTFEVRLSPERLDGFRAALRDTLRSPDDHWILISDDLF
ncbi:MAG TPA: YigZ family protein [Candidatus Ozemobacteraceae bacterium]|nr:YigZ family protein [Candidatus Ozemobacteraceae bacterium]